MKVGFFIEDSYGPEFIGKVFRQKIQTNEIHQNAEFVYPQKFSAFDPSLGRKIRAKCQGVDKVVIVLDADGGSIENVESRTRSTIDSEYQERVRVAVLDNEIEEWICYSKDIPLRGRKPSDALKSRESYDKFMLPRYADDIDCAKLIQCRSFQRFLKAINE